MEYSQTWKAKVTPAGRRYLAHTASARRTSGKDFTGWPTADANTMNDGETLETFRARQEELKKKHGNGNGAGMPLAVRCADAALTGWATATARDMKSEHGSEEMMRRKSERPEGKPLSKQALGAITGLFRVPTGRRAVLAPEFSLWLMGFPEAWVAAAPGAKDWLEAQAALASECSEESGTQSSPSSPPSL